MGENRGDAYPLLTPDTLQSLSRKLYNASPISFISFCGKLEKMQGFGIRLPKGEDKFGKGEDVSAIREGENKIREGVLKKGEPE